MHRLCIAALNTQVKSWTRTGLGTAGTQTTDFDPSSPAINLVEDLLKIRERPYTHRPYTSILSVGIRVPQQFRTPRYLPLRPSPLYRHHRNLPLLPLHSLSMLIVCCPRHCHNEARTMFVQYASFLWCNLCRRQRF